jgi:predicted flap endonuclease-1-like 5' DNA nuclease
VNGLTLLVLIALAIGIVVAYRTGFMRGRRDARTTTASLASVTSAPTTSPPAPAIPSPPPASAAPVSVPAASAQDADRYRLDAFAEDRRNLHRELALAREETARYRQLVVDIENNAPPPLLDAPGTPDDLKLIVGVGPVLERMLYQLGITTYRQIAQWSDQDIDATDARLPEFHGRIRRDEWVTQARALHQSKYGEAIPPRGRPL